MVTFHAFLLFHCYLSPSIAEAEERWFTDAEEEETAHVGLVTAADS